MEITISLPPSVENALLKKAKASGQDIKTVVEHIIEISIEPGVSPVSDSEFEKDMLAFAEGTENIPSHAGDYSRREMYADHD